MPSGVHDSAFIVNAYRASLPDVSLDRFAHLWVSEENQKWAAQYAEKIGPNEILVHALRHRFSLDGITKFLDAMPAGVFVNIGAGFTNYPYLIPSGVPCCEVDTENNINLKKRRLAEFEKSGNIPPREIKFIAANDLNDPAQVSSLGSMINEWLAGRPSFVLCEGVFFYLNIEAIRQLYRMLSSIQQTGDIVASTSFRPEESGKAMYQRLVDYCRSDYRMKRFTPTNVPTGFYSGQSGYSLVSHENYLTLGEKYAPGRFLSRDEVLEEDCYVLERL